MLEDKLFKIFIENDYLNKTTNNELNMYENNYILIIHRFSLLKRSYNQIQTFHIL